MAIRGMLREGFFYEQHGEPVDGSSLAHLSLAMPRLQLRAQLPCRSNRAWQVEL